MADPKHTISRTFVVKFHAVAGMRAMLAAGAVAPVEVAVQLPRDDCGAYIEALPRIVQSAREAAGERMLDPGKFRTDAALFEAGRSLGEHLTPTSVEIVPKGPVREFLVEADYARNEGPFGDTFPGADREEAEFDARWIMTENAGHSLGKDSPSSFAAVMRMHRIRDIVPQPTSEQRLRDLLVDLVREVRAAGHSGPALDAAVAAAETLGLDVTPDAAPRM